MAVERVLVVEDEADLRELLTVALSMEGYGVVTAACGVEAVLEAGRRDFTAVVLDLDLPELGGGGVTRVLRDLGGTPIIAVSGKSGSWQEELLRQGVSACLRKPYDISRLISLIRDLGRLRREREGIWPTDVRRLSEEDLAAVGRLEREEIDRLPFGAIALDRDGRITEFNAFEEEASSYAAPAVIGKRFEEVAPCIKVKEFAGEIERGLRAEPLDEVLRFVFPRYGGESLVTVRLYRDDPRDRVWIFVSERSAGT